METEWISTFPIAFFFFHFFPFSRKNILFGGVSKITSSGKLEKAFMNSLTTLMKDDKF